MRIKVVLLLAVLAGLVLLSLRTSKPTNTPVTTASQPAAQAVAQRPQPASAKVDPVAATAAPQVKSLSPEEAWSQPVTEPEFGRSRRGLSDTNRQPPQRKKTLSIPKGSPWQPRACARWRTDPVDAERAIALAIPASVRGQLPAKTAALAEESVRPATTKLFVSHRRPADFRWHRWCATRRLMASCTGCSRLAGRSITSRAQACP